jgi:hypothetical protein
LTDIVKIAEGDKLKSERAIEEREKIVDKRIKQTNADMLQLRADSKEKNNIIQSLEGKKSSTKTCWRYEETIESPIERLYQTNDLFFI